MAVRSALAVLLFAALAALFATPASAIRPDERTFTMFAAANATGQWRVRLAIGSKLTPGVFTPVNCTSNVAGGCPNSIPLMQDRGDLLRVNYTLATPRGANGNLNTFKGLEPTKIEARICYSLGHAVDRAWRKKNKPYPRLSQNCPRKAGSVDFVGGRTAVNTVANSGVFVMDFDAQDQIPTSAWFVMLWVYCGEEVCAHETTETGAQIAYFETAVEMGVTPGMRAAAIILSIFSPTFFFLYLIADHLYYKRTGKGIRIA